MHADSHLQSIPSTGQFLALAAFFGIATGLLEGLGLWIFHGLGLWNSRIPEGVSGQIVAISAIVNLVLFLAAGLLLLFLRQLLTRLPWMRIAAFVFCFLLFVDVLGVTGRIGALGIIVFSAGLATVVSRRLASRIDQVASIGKRLLPALVILTLAAFVGAYGSERWHESAALRQLPPAANNAPNVLVIVVDTLRADHTSLYSYNRNTTPYLQSLAHSGTFFSQAISSSSWTLPAHQSLLTGRYPHEHGPMREQVVNQNLPSLARVLAARGYRTGGFSANTDFFCRRAGFAQSFLHFEDYFYSLGDAVYRTFWGRLVFRTYVSDLLDIDELPARKNAAAVNREALTWIDQDHSRPFFAFLNYVDVHYPYVPQSPYRNRFVSADAERNCVPPFLTRLNPLHRQNEFQSLGSMSNECLEVQVARYDGAVSYVDDQISDLFAELQRRGLSQNTAVVVTSDHGEEFRDHGLVTHGTSLYRELIQVPLIVWWPGHVPAGLRINRPVSIASLPATVLDLLGDADLQQFPIPSLARLWTDPMSQSTWPDPISEMARDLYIPSNYPAYKGWIKAITDPQWHLIVSQSDPSELYDWPQDPAELHNLAESEKGKAVVADINARLWSQVRPADHTKAGSDPAGSQHAPLRAAR